MSNCLPYMLIDVTHCLDPLIFSRNTCTEIYYLVIVSLFIIKGKINGGFLTIFRIMNYFVFSCFFVYLVTFDWMPKKVNFTLLDIFVFL